MSPALTKNEYGVMIGKPLQTAVKRDRKVFVMGKLRAGGTGRASTAMGVPVRKRRIFRIFCKRQNHGDFFRKGPFHSHVQCIIF